MCCHENVFALIVYRVKFEKESLDCGMFYSMSYKSMRSGCRCRSLFAYIIQWCNDVLKVENYLLYMYTCIHKG